MASISVVKSASPSPVVGAIPRLDLDIDGPAVKKRKLSHDNSTTDDSDFNAGISSFSSQVISIKVRARKKPLVMGKLLLTLLQRARTTKRSILNPSLSCPAQVYR